ncbi:hypothetical protein, partial [Pseudomonas sp. UBA6562]|uniref:hypothetical protein n=1 Tax=Pseudomonas sp. UBA6562 TaxID=1947332 RepID=UPI0025F7AC18
MQLVPAAGLSAGAKNQMVFPVFFIHRLLAEHALAWKPDEACAGHGPLSRREKSNGLPSRLRPPP